MRRPSTRIWQVIVLCLLAGLILLATARAFIGIERSSSQAALEVARQAVRRSVMTCYSLEGAYPPNLEYLSQNYGLILEPERYSYLYEVVGDNVFPVIDIQRLEDVRS